VRDVTSMRLALRRMESLRPFPDSEHELWRFDQKLNRRGIPVDLIYVREAIKLSEAADIETIKTLKWKTALDNPNSDDQIKSWLDANGYPMVSIAKELVDKALVDKKLPAPVREVLELRERLSGAGPSKLYAIVNRVCGDGKLRNEIKYGGAHTMRASSSGMQIHNIPKPTRLVSKRLAELTESIRSGHGIPEGLDPIEVITGTLRSSLCPLPGYKFVTGDFKSVENRVLAWISCCLGMMDIFHLGIDPYKSFAAFLYNKPYEEVTEEERNQTKAVVLGAGYGMGARKLLRMARKGGVVLTLAEAKKHLEVFHAAYPEIRVFHKALETAAKRAIKYKKDVAVGRLLLKGSDRRYLEILLPSGRSMFYQRVFK